MLLLFTFVAFYKTFDSIAFTLMPDYVFRIKAFISAVEATPKYIFSDHLFYHVTSPSSKDGIVVPAAPVRPKQEEFEFVKDCKGREWDYCALVTNDEKMNASMISQLYRDRGDRENNFDEFKNQRGWTGFNVDHG